MEPATNSGCREHMCNGSAPPYRTLAPDFKAASAQTHNTQAPHRYLTGVNDSVAFDPGRNGQSQMTKFSQILNPFDPGSVGSK